MNKSASKCATRAELARRLEVIRGNLSMMMRLFPDRAEFFNEFISFVDEVKEPARPEDQEWVDDQIKQMLQDHGMD